MKNERLAKTSVILDRILKIAQGFLTAGIIISLIFIPLTLIFREKIIASADVLKIGNLTLHLTGDMKEYLNIPAIIKSILISLCVSALSCAAAWYCVRILRSIMVPMKEGHPFEEGISGKIRTLGWTVLVCGAIIEAGRTAAGAGMAVSLLCCLAGLILGHKKRAD